MPNNVKKLEGGRKVPYQGRKQRSNKVSCLFLISIAKMSLEMWTLQLAQRLLFDMTVYGHFKQEAVQIPKLFSAVLLPPAEYLS